MPPSASPAAAATTTTAVPRPVPLLPPPAPPARRRPTRRPRQRQRPRRPRLRRAPRARRRQRPTRVSPSAPGLHRRAVRSRQLPLRRRHRGDADRGPEPLHGLVPVDGAGARRAWPRGTFVGDAVAGLHAARSTTSSLLARPAPGRVPLQHRVGARRAAARRDRRGRARPLRRRSIDALVAAGIRPMITMHHFSSPVWVDDPRHPGLPGRPERHEPVRLGRSRREPTRSSRSWPSTPACSPQRYGDRVDDWGHAQRADQLPARAATASASSRPGGTLLLSDFGALTNVIRNYIRAHVAIYDAIKEADTVDADGDGVAAQVGLHPERRRVAAEPQQRPERPTRRRRRGRSRALCLPLPLPDALIHGGFDADLDGDARGRPSRLDGQARLARRPVLQPPGRQRGAAAHPGAEPDGLLRQLRLRRLRSAGRSHALRPGHGLRVLRARHLRRPRGLRAALAGFAADGHRVRPGDRERHASRRARGPLARTDPPRHRRGRRRARLLPLEPVRQLRVGLGLRSALRTLPRRLTTPTNARPPRAPTCSARSPPATASRRRCATSTAASAP